MTSGPKAQGSNATFAVFDADLVRTHLLGPAPSRYVGDAPFGKSIPHRAETPSEWPTDKTGQEYFHRALVRLLTERGGTPEAAASIRRDLEDGDLSTVVVDDQHGHPAPIPARLWRASQTAGEMYWKGRAGVSVTDGNAPRLGWHSGDIYLVDPPADAPPRTLDLDESVQLCKLLLHLVGKKSASQIADNSAGTDYAVPPRTVSEFIRIARERLRES